MTDDGHGLRVVKLGGSTLRAPTDLETSVQRLHARDDTPVVVVSALDGVTDRLIDQLDDTRETESTEALLDALAERHRRFAATPPSLETVIDPLLAELTGLLGEADRTNHLEPETRDHILSFGERLSARVVANALAGAGQPSQALDADDLGIVTDGSFGRASADLGATVEAIASRLRSLVAEGTVPVITGYFGRDASGRVTTFGRGGSDYSGAIVASALDADRYEVWTDVDGFLTAEPDRLPSARPISYMTYDEAAELAYLGVRVLHPRTLEPLRDREIPVLVTHFDRSGFEGTRIGPPVDEPDQLRAIGAAEGFGIVRMHGSSMAYQPGVGEAVFSTLHGRDITVVNMAASQATFALLVDDESTVAAAETLESAAIPTVESVTHEEGYALVCIVGRNIGLREGVAGRVFTILGNAGINVDMISVGSSNVAMSFVVDEADLSRALTVLHDELFEAGTQPSTESVPTVDD